MTIPAFHCEARKVSCQHCGGPMIRRRNEPPSQFARRRYCSRQCSGWAQRPAFTWEKFDALTDRAGEGVCWPWLGRLEAGGYARVWKDGRKQFAHRLAYARGTGIDPGTLDVLHHCDNPRCLNPQHLWLGTQTDNNNDMWQKQRARVPVGQKHGHAKLSEVAVRHIRASEAPPSDLARRYGVTRQLIVLVRARRIWKHVQ